MVPMFHCQLKAGTKGKSASAVKHSDYVLREGKYADRSPLEGPMGYGNMPSFAQDDPRTFWEMSDRYEGKVQTVYREAELAFPVNSTPEQRRGMIDSFCQKNLGGFAYMYAIHSDKGNPHAHLMFCDREQDSIDRPVDLFFKRAAAPYRHRKTKEMVAADPSKGGCGKADEWVGKDRGRHTVKVRKSWADIENAHFKSIGSSERVDHRSLVDQKDEALKIAELMGQQKDSPVAKRVAHDHLRKAALLDRPADQRISRSEWKSLEKSGELEQVKELRAAHREVAEGKALLVDLEYERSQQKEATPAPAPIVEAEAAQVHPVLVPESAQSEALPAVQENTPSLPQPAGDVEPVVESGVSPVKSELAEQSTEAPAPPAAEQETSAKAEPAAETPRKQSVELVSPAPIKAEPVAEAPKVEPVAEAPAPIKPVAAKRSATIYSSPAPTAEAERPAEPEPAPVKAKAEPPLTHRPKAEPPKPPVEKSHHTRLTEIDTAMKEIEKRYTPTPAQIAADKETRHLPELQAWQADVDKVEAKYPAFKEKVEAWKEEGKKKNWDSEKPSWFPSAGEKAWREKKTALDTERHKMVDEKQPAIAQVGAWREHRAKNDGTELRQEAAQQRNADPEYQKLKVEQAAVKSVIRDEKKAADKDKGKDVEDGRSR